MAWPFSERETVAQLVERTIGNRNRRGVVGRRDALRHSVVWACLRLRADLMSTMPLDVFRRVGGVQVAMTKPPVLIEPGGKACRLTEWLYSSQIDLDSCGNSFGIITARDALSLPARIELVSADEVTLRNRKGVMSVVVNGEPIDYANVWHEKQYTIPGLAIGLSPITYAALTLDAGLSAQEFARSWFNNGATPSAHFKNNARILKDGDAARIKRRFAETVQDGEPLVTGKDWDYSMLGAKASESGFLDQHHATNDDVTRFLGVPGDMVDVQSTSGSVTYANITQRNLQLLIMHLGPAIARREEAISFGLLPQPRYAKFNTAALLRMDLAGRYAAYGVGIDKRFLAPSEARDLENLPPFTPEQEAEFGRLFTSKGPTPVPAPTPETGGQP